MHCSWAADAVSPSGRSMLWVFPPFPLVGCVISKLLVERVNAILVVPVFMRYWTAMLRQLPIVDQVRLSYHEGLYTIGSRAPIQ